MQTVSEKAELRILMREKRKALSATSRNNQDQQLLKHLISLPSVQSSRVLVQTLSINGECDTWSFARWVIAHKGFVVLPRVVVESQTPLLTLHRVDDLEKQIQPGFQNIYEPKKSCECIEIRDIEWILLPGLAFDLSGGRLGYGGGYFDRLLVQMLPTTYKIGLGYRFQLLDQIPVGPHDQYMDTIVLPMGPVQTRRLFTEF